MLLIEGFECWKGHLREPIGKKRKLKAKEESLEAKYFVSDSCKQINVLWVFPYKWRFSVWKNSYFVDNVCACDSCKWKRCFYKWLGEMHFFVTLCWCYCTMLYFTVILCVGSKVLNLRCLIVVERVVWCVVRLIYRKMVVKIQSLTQDVEWKSQVYREMLVEMNPRSGRVYAGEVNSMYVR